MKLSKEATPTQLAPIVIVDLNADEIARKL